MPPPTIWRDIADDLRRRVDAGEWAAGERIPSVRELMEHYDTPTQGALVRAISALANEGVLITDPNAPRRGVRVRGRIRLARPIDQHFAGLRPGQDRTFEELSDLGPGDVDVRISFDLEPAGALAELFGDEELLVRTFRYLVTGTPHQVMRSWMPARIAESAGLHAPNDEVPGRSTESWLQAGGAEPHHVSMALSSRLPTPEEAADLEMPTALPIMVRRRTVLDPHGSAVETSTALVVGDQITYTAEFDLGDTDPC
ncbi:GntR family transcriptional regulator [Nocardia sp. JMUB6875]|uniref:GntR family transcriptional regulator n=1 Tax=Nocardia sp. JMUB6875 TaxID=3158170 RepID=UPI0032E734B1